MSLNLLDAHYQWATRPNDERFETLQEGRDASYTIHTRSHEKEGIKLSDLELRTMGMGRSAQSELVIVGPSKVPTRMTNYAFGQVAQFAGAPAGYMRKLPPLLAANCVNFSMKQRIEAERLNGNPEANVMLYSKTGSAKDVIMRAFTSTGYERLWDYEVFDMLLEFEAKGWKTPPARPVRGNDPRQRPATRDDVSRLSGTHGLSVSVGDMIAPAGIYASDHDMWCFLVDENNPIDDGFGGRLGRGMFVWNGEVGQRSYGAMQFLYRSVCGNHIVWDAEGIKTFRFNHTKNIHERFEKIQKEMETYAHVAASKTEKQIKWAKAQTFGKDKASTVEGAVEAAKKAAIPITKKSFERAYDLADRFVERFGDPNSYWAVVNGLTEISQEEPYADVRTDLDKAAGKFMTALTAAHA